MMVCVLHAAETVEPTFFFFNENHLIFNNGLQLAQFLFKVLYDSKAEDTQN